ncbi:MAG: hypothetical protein IKV59_07410 [Lachnospiraceae bacterium]|nr:hypothetical protein [Lachnospiraceae bacterium]
MECCTIIIIGVVVYIIYVMWEDACKEDAKKMVERNEMNARKSEQIKRIKEDLDRQFVAFSNVESDMGNSINNIFLYANSYKEIRDRLDKLINDIELMIPHTKSLNQELSVLSYGDNRMHKITELESTVLPRAKFVIKWLNEFEQKVYSFPECRMIDLEHYGKVDRKYWESIKNMQRPVVLNYMKKCESTLQSGNFEHIQKIAIEDVLKCVWFFAVENPFSASDFQSAEHLFKRIYKKFHIDVTIADLYAKKKVGGEDCLSDMIRALLKGGGNSKNQVDTLTQIASALMWMNAYKTENMVLQHMLTFGMQMSPKAQERLHSFASGRGKAPNSFDVNPSQGFLYFDVSALVWKDDEYIGLFENLAFQDKKLTYSLAVRDEDKELFLSQGITVPDTGMILNQLKSVLFEEYGSKVAVRLADCKALSGSGEERIQGVLVSSVECRHMGILVHIAGIGKKLVIKFYTLFMPTASDISEQKQQALSIYNKLSPSVTMWESSLKDTMLMAIQQILNSNTQFVTAGAGTGEDKSGRTTNDVVF